VGSCGRNKIRRCSDRCMPVLQENGPTSSCASLPPSRPLRPFHDPPSLCTQRNLLCTKLLFSLSKLHEAVLLPRNRYSLFASFCGAFPSENNTNITIHRYDSTQEVINYASNMLRCTGRRLRPMEANRASDRRTCRPP